MPTLPEEQAVRTEEELLVRQKVHRHPGASGADRKVLHLKELADRTVSHLLATVPRLQAAEVVRTNCFEERRPWTVVLVSGRTNSTAGPGLKEHHLKAIQKCWLQQAGTLRAA